MIPVFLICSGVFAVESRLPFSTVFKGQDQFNRLVAKAKSENWQALPIGERTAAVGLALITTVNQLSQGIVSLYQSITGDLSSIGAQQ